MTALAILVAFAAAACAAVPSEIRCPSGTMPNGETTPDVSEVWCEITKDGQTVQHGPYRAWWRNGRLGNEGQYEYGKPIGRWRAWYETGELQGEEWFENGKMVKGRYFDKQGNQVPPPKT